MIEPGLFLGIFPPNKKRYQLLSKIYGLCNKSALHIIQVVYNVKSAFIARERKKNKEDGAEEKTEKEREKGRSRERIKKDFTRE